MSTKLPITLRDKPAVEAYLLGVVDFEACLALQQRLVYETAGRSDGQITLLVCEHPLSITVGRQGSRAMLPFLYNSHGSTGELLFQTRFCVRRRFGDLELATSTLDALDSTRGMLANLILYHERR